jgi:hypothetical protein
MKKVYLVNNGPIINMLFHEKIFKVGNETIESAEPTSGAEEPTTEAQGQRIDGLPEMEQPAEPTSGTGGQKICELPQANEPAPGLVDPTSGAEKQGDHSGEKREYDECSGLSSCWTQAASILDKVIHGGDQPAFANFANFNCESESENPIPPEYEAGAEYLSAALKQFPMPPPPTPSKADARPEIHEDPPGFAPKPLTEENLSKNAQALRASIAIPSRPYPYMKNPLHPDPWSMLHGYCGAPLGCYDGCIDCEVYPTENGSRTWRVHNWFENYFTHHDMYWGNFGKNPSHPSLKHLEVDPDADNPGIDIIKRKHDEDFLLGAEGCDDFFRYKYAFFNDPEDTHQDICTLLVQYMQLGEICDEDKLNLSYYYGERFDAILAEYEPRFLPNVDFSYDDNKLHVLRYPGIDDMSKPIWEARGCPFPVQADNHTRMEYAKSEYNRKWLMFRAKDDARQRYIQQVFDAARDEYIQRGLWIRLGE